MKIKEKRIIFIRKKYKETRKTSTTTRKMYGETFMWPAVETQRAEAGAYDDETKLALQ